MEERQKHLMAISWPSKKQFSTAGKATQAAELIAPANPPFHPSKGLRHTQNCRNIDGGFSAVNPGQPSCYCSDSCWLPFPRTADLRIGPFGLLGQL